MYFSPRRIQKETTAFPEILAPNRVTVRGAHADRSRATYECRINRRMLTFSSNPTPANSITMDEPP